MLAIWSSTSAFRLRRSSSSWRGWAKNAEGDWSPVVGAGTGADDADGADILNRSFSPRGLLVKMRSQVKEAGCHTGRRRKEKNKRHKEEKNKSATFFFLMCTLKVTEEEEEGGREREREGGRETKKRSALRNLLLEHKTKRHAQQRK